MRTAPPTARITLLVMLWVVLARSARGGDLEPELHSLIDGHQGKVAVAVKHLGAGEAVRVRADEVMPTASLIKLAVMMEVYQQAAEGKVRLDDAVTLQDSDKVPGSGILTAHFSGGTTFSLLDATRLMIVFSDNTATNLVLDRIGIGSTAARMEAGGFPNTKIHSKVFRRDTSVFPERSREFGLGSTTADGMIGLVEELHAGTRYGADARAAMLDHLKHCEDKDKFSRLLPAGTVVAHKTGSLDECRTDAGLVITPSGPVALCVLTNDNEDKSWTADNAGNLLCARIARLVYDHFARVSRAE